MASNPYANKVTVNNTTIIDLTADTAIASDVASGKYFHLASGERVVGTASGGGGDTYTLTTVVPQQTFTPQDRGGTYQALLTYTAGIENGEGYLVTFDGEEYLCDCYLQWGSEYTIGDIAFLWQTSGYLQGALPFGLDYIPSDNNFVIGVGDLNQHTVKVERLEFVDGPLNLITKSITANGTYAASSDSADGYSEVTVNVPTGSSNEFVVTMTLGQDDLYYPDCTYAEARQALRDNKTLVFFADNNVACSYDWDSSGITYFVDMLADAGYGDDVFRLEFRWTSSGVTFVGDEQFIIPSGSQSITTNNTYDVTRLSSVTVSVPTGGGSAQTATGTFTGNGTRTIDISSVNFEPDIVYFTCNPGTTASSGTVAAIIVRDMMTATRYRNNSTTNSHFAIPDIANLNTSGSSYSWRATYDSTNSKLTLYCYSNNARALLTNGRTYSYKFIKWT